LKYAAVVNNIASSVWCQTQDGRGLLAGTGD